MKLSKKFKKQLKKRFLTLFSCIAIAITLVGMKLADFAVLFKTNIESADYIQTVSSNENYNQENANEESMQSESDVLTESNLETLGISTYSAGATINGESILKILEDNNLETGYYTFEINAEEYPVHFIEFDENQEWIEDQTFGDESDVGTSTTEAQNMVIVKVNGDLTIGENVKVTTFSNEYGGPKGFLLYVTGTLTNNGEITMTAKGAKAEGQDVYLWKNADGTYEHVPAEGAIGAESITVGYANGAPGIDGEKRQTGGGGSGAVRKAGKSGVGGTGTSYSGGTGGGASNTQIGQDGLSNGAAGGAGFTSSSNKECAVGGGAGNPGGSGSTKGSNGTGGLLTIYADNYINNGSITSNGSTGGNAEYGGGSSGGGSINIFINNSVGIDQLGIITDTRYNEILKSVKSVGGLNVGGRYKGGAGGTGTVNIGEIRNGQYYDLKEIIEQDKAEFIENSTIRGESILKIVEENELASGYYVFKVQEELYPVHLITYNTNQEWMEDQTFGDEVDVGTDATEAQNMVIVKVNGDLTIGENVKITTFSNEYGGPKGFLLYVTGTLTNNGEITMTAKGAKAEGQDVYLWKNIDGTYEYVPAEGAIGAESITVGYKNGNPGIDGKQRQTGGGGSGAIRSTGTSGKSGAGGTGTSYSGGTGGGGASGTTAQDGSSTGKTGGAGNTSSTNKECAVGGGAGNPGGSGSTKGSNGTGGLLTIYADNYINNGSITSNGSTGGNAVNGGGSSGGGSINIFANTVSQKGSYNVSGGSATGTQYKGGAGGTGTVTINELTPNLIYYEKELFLNVNNDYIIDKNKIQLVGQNSITVREITLGELEYSSLNTDIAIVNEDGKITALKNGRTKIKITDTTNNLSTYIYIEVIDNIKEDIRQGNNFTIILKPNGTVWGYGLNTSGQIGIKNCESQTEPIQIPNLNDIKEISTGYSHSLALTKDGEVYSWGQGTKGQLGNGEDNNSNQPIKIQELSNIKKIDSYKNVSLALSNDGNVYIWGEGYSSTPTLVNCKYKIADISGKILLGENGFVYELSDLYNAIDNLRGISKISAGAEHYLALADNGIVYSWGKNTYGETGSQTTGTMSVIEIANNIFEISAGNGISCLLSEDMKAYVIGNNANGQIGLDSVTKVSAVTEINLSEDVLIRKISAGEGTHSGIIDENGFVWQTGLNTYGELGLGDNTNRKIFTKICDTQVSLNARNEYIKIGDIYDIDVIKAFEFNVFLSEFVDQSDWTWKSSNEDVATIDDDGIVTGKGVGHTTITGYNSKADLKAKAIINVYRNIDGAITVPQVEEGLDFTIVLKEDGTVWSSGKNNLGQLGNGTTTNSNIPVQVKIDSNTYLTNVRKISSSYLHTIAVTDNGEVYVWGSNEWEALGQDNKENKKYATRVKGVNGVGYLENIIDISAGVSNSYAINSSGELYGWGSGKYYEINNSKSSNYKYPVKMQDYNDVITTDGGNSSSIIMQSNSEVWVRGYNPRGQLGNGKTSISDSQTYMIGTDIDEFVLSMSNGIILKEDKTVWTTGGNEAGQLGLGDNTDRATYTQVKLENGELLKAKNVQVGNSNIAILGIDKKVYVIGNNKYGQLCDGTNDNATFPIILKNSDGTEVTDAIFVEVGENTPVGSTPNPAKNISIIRKDGSVWLSGDNTYGQIGNTTNVSTNYLTEMGDDFLNYPEKNIILKVNQTKAIDKKLFSVQDDINVFIDATSKLGNLNYEIEDETIASIDNNGTIKANSQGITKIKVTDDKLGLSTYIWVKVVEQENVQISLGYKFTVALKQDGTLWSWGQNHVGQLGLGNTTTYNEPQKITGISEKIVDVKTGYYHSTALTENGEVYTFGYNYYGQLGDGTKINNADPVKINGLSNIVKIYSHKNRSMALTKDGEVYIWGRGYGTTPVKLEFSRKIIDIAGDIVLAENRRAYNLDETISYGKDLIKISAGENHYLGLTADGEVYSWGTNKDGELGNGNNTSSSIPTKVVVPNGSTNITDIVDISAGNNYSIISDKDGNVYTFGNNSNNRLGGGASRNKPEKIEGLSKIELVSASEGNHTAVVDWDGYVYTVGLNDYGQLGLKDKINRASFEMVGELQVECNPNQIKMSVGDTQDISLSLSSSFNLKSDLQNINTINTKILNESIATISNNTVTGKTIGKTILSASYEGAIGTVNTDIKKFTRNIEIFVLPEGGIAVPKVESGDRFTVSLKSDGTVWSWGQNQYGQLGLGNTEAYNEPQKVKIIKEIINNPYGSKTEIEEKIIDIAVGNYQTLALSETGKVYSWGLGTNGQLGIGNKYSKYEPVIVTDTYKKELKDIVKIEAGENVSFAIDSKGIVYAWGRGYALRAQKLDVVDNIVDVTSKYVLSADRNVYSIDTKERLELVEDIVELDEGKDHTVFLTSEGKGYSIGDNTYGQLGNGNNVSSNDTPVAIKNKDDQLFTNIKEIKAGDRYTVIVTNDGDVYAVGINDNNELGIENTEILDRNLPEINENINNVIFATAGENHVTVIKNDGTVYSWGNGEFGQLGNRRNENSINPVMVGDYVVRTNTNRVILGVNSEKVIEGIVDYFNVFNNDAIDVTYDSKDTSVVELANTQTENTQVTSTLNSNNKFEIKLVGKKFGTTIVTAHQKDSTNIGVIQVEVIPEGKEIEPMVATNGSHTIALRVDGKVYTYGDNTYGQLGNGTTISSDEPVEVQFPEGIKIVQIAVGEYHNVALDSNGAVWTWGRNNNYQIGHKKENQYTPYKITGIPKVIKISAGNNNTMVITENNELYGWGLNAYGNLGIGNYTNKVLPTKVKGITDIIDISGGKSHYIALNRAGEIFTTGSNLYGQLGLGEIEKSKANEFTKIEIDEKVGAINAGELSNIVTTVDGYVYAWGANINGQLGTSDNTNKNSPTKIENVQNIRQVSIGKTHAIIRDGNNKSYLAGANTYGQLGNGTNDSTSIFKENQIITDVLRVTAGNTYTCFLREDGFVWASGDYNHGDKTKKSKSNSKVPILVGSDSSSLDNLEIVIMKNDTKSIMANAKFKFNLIYIEENDTSDFRYSSYNDDIAKVNQKGDILGVREGTTWVKAVDGKTGQEHIAIVRVIDNTKEYDTHVAPKIVAGENFAIGLKEDGTVWSWGFDDSRLAENNIPSNLNVLSTYKDVTAGKNHALAIRDDGTVWAVGNNEYGQLGIGNTDNKSKLVQIEGLTDIIQIAGGENHSIAIDSYGIIYGFGENSNGQLGNEYIGENTTSPVIITIPSERIIQISAGKDESVFVTSNGTVYGMGKTLNGYLPNITDAVKAEVGDGYILILREDGSVYRYQYEKLTKVQNIKNAIDISVQNKVNMYQSVDEKVYTWGINSYGQLGTGTNTSSSIPTQPVENGTNVFRMGAGYNNTYIISNTGFVYASGTNNLGELGNGTNENDESTTKELSLTHILVGDRNFKIKPESNTLEINEIENLKIESNIFNVFRDDKNDVSEYEWISEDETILTVLDDGIIEGINLGTTKVIATDKITGQTSEGIRAVVPLNENRIEFISANGKDANVVESYQYEVKIPVDEDITKANVIIKTKLETDSISINNGATWVNGRLSTVVNIPDNLTSIPFIVKTEAGNELNYTLTIIKISNNNKLENITIKPAGSDIEAPATKVEDKVYEAIVPSTGVHKIKVNSEHDKAYVSIRGLAKQLKEQTYNLVMKKPVEEIPIKITSESGREENYTLFVYREDYVASLKDIVVNGVKATKISDDKYEVNIKQDINETSDKLKVTATTNLSTATVGINSGEKQVHTITEKIEDTTVVTIEVEEPITKLTKEYTLTINKIIEEEPDNPDDPDNPIIKDDVAIDKILVNELIGYSDIEAVLSKTERNVYEVYLQNAVQKVKVKATTKDSSSQIKIADNTYSIAEDVKEIEIDSTLTEMFINVCSDFGAEKEYVLRIYTISDDTDLKEVTVGTENARYNNITGRYEIKVDRNLTQYDITVEAEENNATLEIDDKIEIGTIGTTISKIGAETVVLVKVKAPNGISEEVHELVILEKSDITDIEIVKVNGVEIIPNQDGNYIANIISTTEEVKIFAQTIDEYADITIDGETNNKNNMTITREILQDITIYNIEVLAEDGNSTITKQLTINRLNGNTEVEKVTIVTPNGNTYTAIEDDGVYYCKVPRQDSVNVTVSLVSNTSEVSVAGGDSTETILLLNEITEVNALIEAEDETQRIIIIKIEKESNDANLSDILIPLAKKVSKIDENKYEIQVDDRLESIMIDAITTNENADIKLGTEVTYTKHKIQDKEITISGINSFTINVLAEDGVTAKTYTIEITKIFNTDIKSIKTDGEDATNNEYEYIYNGWVDNDDIANIVITAENPLAKISVYKNIGLLKEDIGVVEFEDEMTNQKEIYSIIVTGPDSESSEYILYTTKKSTNNNIEFVKVNGETLTENTETGCYEIEVGAVINNQYILEINAEDEYAQISLDDEEYSDSNNVQEIYVINPGETKEISVKVKSQNGEEIEKTVSIYRKDNNIQIQSIKVNDIIVSNYDEIRKNYSIVLDNTIDLANLEIILSSDKATVETSIDKKDYSQLKELLIEDIILPEVGKKVITFKVIAEDGTEEIRTITIIQFSSNIELQEVKVNGKLAEKREDGDYEITIGDNPSKASIFAKAKESDSTIIINNTDAEGIGENTIDIGNISEGQILDIPIKVIAEDGTEYEYKLFVTVKSANTNIEYIKVNNNDAEKINDKTYRIFVAPSVNQAVVDIKALSETAIVSANISGIDKVGNPLTFKQALIQERATVEFTVISEFGDKNEYTLEIIKESNDNTIKNVYVNGIEIQKDEETGRYKITIDEADENPIVKVIANNKYAYVRIGVSEEEQGKKEERVELKETKITTIPITVRSQTGVTNIEHLDIEVIYTTTAIDTVIVDDKEVTNYNPETKTYTTLIDGKIDEHEIFIMSMNSYATLEINDNIGEGNVTTFVKLGEEDLEKQLPLIITTEAGYSEEYTIRLVKRSDNVNLSEVIVNDVTLYPEEGKIDIYRNTIKNSEDKAKIKVVSEYPYASIRIGDCAEEKGISEQWIDLDLRENEITIPVVVTGADGETIATYNIVLTRSSSDTEITLSYDKNIVQKDEAGNYQVQILDTVTQGIIDVIANNEKAQIDIANTGEYGEGAKEYILEINSEDNRRTIEIPITIIAEDGTEADSKVVITRISTNARAEKVEGIYTLEETDIVKQGNLDDKGIYIVNVPEAITEMKLKVTAKNEYATISRGITSGIGELETDVTLTAKTTVVTFNILAEDGVTSEVVTVKIVRQLSDNTIAKIVVEGNELSPDDNGIYRATVLGGTLSAETIITANSDEATIEIGDAIDKGLLDTNLELNNIENIFTIKVTAEDGKEKEYTLVITKQTNIAGKIITENHEEKHKSLVTLYKTADDRLETYEINPREIITQIETNEDGTFVIDITDIDKYDILVTKEGYLDYRVTDIEVVKGEMITLDEYKLLAGDVVKTGEIEIDDLVAITDKYGISINNQNGEIDENTKYDLNEDEIVNEVDIEILKENYSKKAEVIQWVNPNVDMTVALDEYTEVEEDVDNIEHVQKEDAKIISNNENVDEVLASNEKILQSASNSFVAGEKSDKTEVLEDTNKIENSTYSEKTKQSNSNSSVTFSENGEELEETQEFILPIKCNYIITSKYGTRIHPVTGEEKKHTGIDISGDHHTEIYSVADGEVTFAGVKAGFGNCIEIKHIVNGEAIYSFYAHLSEIKVAEGQVISQGDIIALEGGDPSSDPNPGSSTGHHLHFEIRTASGYGNDVDPNDYIKF